MIPHYLGYIFTKGGKLFQEDLLSTCGRNDFYTFVFWLQSRRYIRNLFYHRMGWKFQFMFEWMLPSDKSFHLYNMQIGRRCHLEHSQNTFLNAKSIGDDFYCLHNVTVGNNGKKHTNPIIGNKVCIFTGAIVAGDIKIGNNVIICANAVVREDVPDNTMVAGVPAKVVKKL